MNARLLILGVLHHGPMHGYEVLRVFEQSRVDRWAGLLKGSVYHALKKMTDEGLLDAATEEAPGGGARLVYRITDAGRGEFLSLVRRAWKSPVSPFPTTLYSALAFFDALPRDELRGAIEQQIASLERELEGWRAAGRIKAGAGVPEHTRILFDGAVGHLETDLRTLKELRLLLLSSSPTS